MRLMPMTDADYAAYQDRLIPDHVDEHVRAGNWPADEAEAKARDQLCEILLDGIRIPDHSLYRLEADGPEPVGIVWFGLVRKGAKVSAFIYDIVIEDAYRRRGYASAALRAVAAKGNARYTRLGYAETDLWMSKAL